MKICKRCGEEKEDLDFGTIISGGNGVQYTRNTCKKCEKVKHKERKANHNLEHNYGINGAQWELILKSQGNKCKICGKEFDSKICVDHNHKTNIIRGLLCSDCNKGLGFF